MLNAFALENAPAHTRPGDVTVDKFESTTVRFVGVPLKVTVLAWATESELIASAAMIGRDFIWIRGVWNICTRFLRNL